VWLRRSLSAQGAVATPQGSVRGERLRLRWLDDGGDAGGGLKGGANAGAAAFEAADAELRRLIGEGFVVGIPGERLAEAAGLSVPRVYRIRDGRR
jgi:hypothetical protein